MNIDKVVVKSNENAKCNIFTEDIGQGIDHGGFNLEWGESGDCFSEHTRRREATGRGGTCVFVCV